MAEKESKIDRNIKVKVQRNFPLATSCLNTKKNGREWVFCPPQRALLQCSMHQKKEISSLQWWKPHRQRHRTDSTVISLDSLQSKLNDIIISPFCLETSDTIQADQQVGQVSSGFGETHSTEQTFREGALAYSCNTKGSWIIQVEGYEKIVPITFAKTL